MSKPFKIVEPSAPPKDPQTRPGLTPGDYFNIADTTGKDFDTITRENPPKSHGPIKPLPPVPEKPKPYRV